MPSRPSIRNTALTSRSLGRTIHHYIDKLQRRLHMRACVGIPRLYEPCAFQFYLLILHFVLIEMTHNSYHNVSKTSKNVPKSKFEFFQEHCLSLSSVCTRKLYLCALFLSFFSSACGCVRLYRVASVCVECIQNALVCVSSYKKMVQ